MEWNGMEWNGRNNKEDQQWNEMDGNGMLFCNTLPGNLDTKR